MKPGNLFTVILKIFGLFFLREIIYIIPQLVSTIPYFTKSDNFGEAQNTNDVLLPFLVTLVILAFYVFVIYLLLFRTNNIVNKLQLDKGFDQEEFSFNISSSLVLTIALIVIGGVILTNEIPNFCRNVFAYFQEKSLTHGMTKPNYSYIITAAVKIILGLLIIGERKRIVGFIENRKTNTEGNETE
jgi:NADH:ubiquinone oxidoreductase subunit 5 (subunit L)/multisubunit Na+/H+ antiporter MnhA subunit